MQRRIFKNITVSEQPYIFVEEPVTETVDEAEANLKARQRQFEEHIIQTQMDLRDQENEILSNAKTQGYCIVKDAESRGEIIKQEKANEGLMEGLNLAAEEYAKEYIHLEEYKQQLNRRCDERIKQIEEQMLDMAFILAEKIIDIEISRNDEAIKKVFKETLDKLKDDKELVMELSQANVDKINSMDLKHNFKTKVNDSLRIDEVLLHSEHGTIDASVKRQFENLKNELIDKLK